VKPHDRALRPSGDNPPRHLNTNVEGVGVSLDCISRVVPSRISGRNSGVARRKLTSFVQLNSVAVQKVDREAAAMDGVSPC